MGLINTLKNTINHLPGIRRPEQYSLMDIVLDNYGWTFTKANKTMGNLQTYYQAYNNCIWVRRCCGVLCDELIGNNFKINNPNSVQVNYERVNYLTDLFTNPEGKYAEATFSSLMKQIIPSWKVTGDSFIEVNHDKIFDNIISGFKFIPTELMEWNTDNGQWKIRNTDYSFEPENIIHIYEPRIQLKSSRWGASVIDTVAMDISLEVLGLNHNREVFENHGLDPRGVLSFDKDLSSNTVKANINRLKKQKNKKGIIAVQGGNYTRTNPSNKEMEFLELLFYARDKIISAFGVPPAKAGIIETANLGSGSGEAQAKDFHKILKGNSQVIENAFNKTLGRSGFQEVFNFTLEDIENKQIRAEIEDKQLRNGSTYINEVRSGYGLEPVEWGNAPMNYSQFAIATSPDKVDEATMINPEVKSLQKALLIERLGKEYDY